MKTTKQIENEFKADTLNTYGIEAKFIVNVDGTFTAIVKSEGAANKLFNIYSKEFSTKLEKHPREEKYFLTMK